MWRRTELWELCEKKVEAPTEEYYWYFINILEAFKKLFWRNFYKSPADLWWKNLHKYKPSLATSSKQHKTEFIKNLTSFAEGNDIY